MQDRLFLTHQNAVINKERENERIDHWVNKNWNIGGDVHAPMEDKLIFLYEIGRRKQVGMYPRNQNILDKLFQAMYKKRAECEKIHGHIKQVVKFDIRRTRNGSKKLYSLLNFVAYQLLVLAELQNKVEKETHLESTSKRHFKYRVDKMVAEAI